MKSFLIHSGLVMTSSFVSLFLAEAWLGHRYSSLKRVARDQLSYTLENYQPRFLEGKDAESFRRLPERPGSRSRPRPFRIAVLGDSIVYGQGVKAEEAFPSQLEKKLKESSLGGEVEVLNMGARGSNLLDTNLFVEKDLLAFRPDLVLFTINTNDGEYNLWNYHPYRYCDNLGPRYKTLGRWIDRWFLGYFIYHDFFRPNQEPLRGPLGKEEDPFFLCTQEKLFRSFSFLRKNKIPFIPLVYFSFLEGSLPCPDGRCHWPRLQEWTRALMGRQGPTPLILNEALVPSPGQTLSSLYLEDHYHLTSEGNRLLAQRLVGQVFRYPLSAIGYPSRISGSDN